VVHPGAAPLLLRVGDQEELTRLVRASSVRAGLAQRARIVLLASEGRRNAEIAERIGVSRPTVNLWRSRYGEAGMAGRAVRGGSISEGSSPRR
jgi:transposase